MAANAEDGRRPPGAAPGKPLAPAAVRALEEAEARRAGVARDGNAKASPTELGGCKGAEPTRYGDWERNGRAVDF